MIYKNALVFAFLAALVACTSSPVRTKASALSPEEAISQRTTDRWGHIIAGDFRKAYDFLTPGARVVMPYEEYASRLLQAQIKWTGMKVVDVVCEDAEACKAQVELDILVTVPMAGQIQSVTYIYEDWLKSGNQWYYLPSQAR